MRKVASALVLALGFGCACNFGPRDPRDASFPADGPPSPHLLQYAEDLTQSWYLRDHARTSRVEIDDVHANGKVHIVTETVCPDRYSVSVRGAETSDTIYIGTTSYERKHGTWTKKALPAPYPGILYCGQAHTEAVDAARVRLVAEQLREIAIPQPSMLEIAGRVCREWSRTFFTEKGSYETANCFDVQTHELVQRRIGATVSRYQWNIPLEIKPPI